ncbi:MAG: AAA family ATPase [Thermoanaerobaculia bacterium]
MRVERLVVDGFGPLEGVDLAWNEGELLLVLEPNETGKSTLCEAIVAALYGLPKGRAAGGRSREARKPRSGAPTRLRIDVSSSAGRFAVERDFDAGTLRVVDRDRGEDRTAEFLRAGGRDAVGEKLTGLTEPLFRTTAYVGQNVLDGDALDASLTVELARIADSGGGEASVVRALRLLDAARARMPEATSGTQVSVETEIVRTGRRVEEKRAEAARLARAREAAAEAASRFASLTRDVVEARRAAALAGVAVVESERRSLAAEVERRGAERRRRAALEEEAARLEREAALFTPETLASLDALRGARGARPEALDAARASLAEERRSAVAEDRERRRRAGGLADLPAEARHRLRTLLDGAAAAEGEAHAAEEALEAEWEELRREGLAEDLRRLDGLAPAEKDFVASAEEDRQALELTGVQLDRRVADSGARAAIAAGERRVLVRRARALVVAAGVVVPVLVATALKRGRLDDPLVLTLTVFAAALAVYGGVAWGRGRGHRQEDEARSREDEAAARAEALEVRRRLSDLRLRLEQAARGAGFKDAAALVRAQRRARAAEERRQRLVEKRVRLHAAAERLAAAERDLDPYRAALGLPTGLPPSDEARRLLQILADLEKADHAIAAREEAFSREEARLLEEETALRALEERMAGLLAGLSVPAGLSLPEALLYVDAGRARAARRKQILDVELPALSHALPLDPDETIAERLDALSAEAVSRLSGLGATVDDLAVPSEPEAARRAAEAARAEAASLEEERLKSEKDLAQKAFEGGGRAREVEEQLAVAEAARDRALLYRDALDVAREVLAAAATTTYGDFRSGLARASREILAACRLPYEALEFGEDLSVTVVARGGRPVTRADLAASVSTGAREQLHLVARLAALRHLGTGPRGLPLLLDDPLVGTDDERFAAVLGFLVEDVLAERPALLVSCHAERHERWAASLPPALAGRVRRVRLGRRNGAGDGAELTPLPGGE